MSKEKTTKSIGSQLLKKYGIGLVLVALLVIGSITVPGFLSIKNVTNVLRQISVTGILALAEGILIISGQIDLSVGSVVALSGMVSVQVYLKSGSLLLGVLVAILISAIVLMASGVLVAKVKLTAFIATMAMDYIARGLCYIYTNGQATYEIGNYNVISTTYVGAIPVPVIVLLVCCVVMAIILNKTTLGRDVFAVGGNQAAANASGIIVDRTIIKTFLVAGLLTGVAAVLQIARVNSVIPSTADGYHGDAIAAAVIGGVSFTGGIGTVGGVLIGSCIMGFLSNFMNLLGLSGYFQQVTKGVIIILALSFDLLTKNNKVKNFFKKKN